MNDAFGQHMDYFMDKNPLWRPMRIHPESETFVEMWRYTRPDAILVNDPRTYSFAPSHDPVHGEKYAFVLGVRGLSRSPERGLERPGTDGPADAARRAVADRLARLWIAGGDYLFHGRFLDDVGLRISGAGVLAKLYRGSNGVAVPLWNTRREPATLDLSVDLEAVGWRPAAAVRAKSLDSGARWPVEGRGRHAKVTLTLPAHEVDVLVLEAVTSGAVTAGDLEFASRGLGASSIPSVAGRRDGQRAADRTHLVGTDGAGARTRRFTAAPR